MRCQICNHEMVKVNCKGANVCMCPDCKANITTFNDQTTIVFYHLGIEYSNYDSACVSGVFRANEEITGEEYDKALDDCKEIMRNRG